MIKHFLLLTGIILISGCGNQPAEVITTNSIADSVKPISDTTKAELSSDDDLEVFSNIEQVDYCVPIPLKEYVLDTKNKYNRAEFVFHNKKNDQLDINLIGMFRSDPKVSIEDYFKNSYTEEDEAEGKVIETKG